MLDKARYVVVSSKKVIGSMYHCDLLGVQTCSRLSKLDHHDHRVSSAINRLCKVEIRTPGLHISSV